MEELNKLYESIDKKVGDESAKSELKKQMKEYIEEIKTTGNIEKLKAVVVLLQKFIEEQNEVLTLFLLKKRKQYENYLI